MGGRALVAFAIVAALVAVPGCGAPGTVELGEKDDGRTVKVAPGKTTLVVMLPSNPSTGFSWLVASDAGLKQIGEAEFKQEGPSGVVGAGGTETLRFEATEDAGGELTLQYARPWESRAPAKTWSVTIEVQ